METINADGKSIKLILVKNPTGFNQVINFLATEEKNMSIAFLINDNLADGTDISWLWDVDFEMFEEMKDRVNAFFTSGIRGEDMSVRLKYAGVPTDKIKLCHDYNELLAQGLASVEDGANLYILPTYTAMLDIRGILANKYGLKEFWK
jgi:UDP-N-acetylmuramyl tripeptide synthase